MNEARKTLALAGHYLSISRPERTLELLSQAAGEEIEQVEFWRLRCQALEALERYAEAKEAAQAGLAQHPDDVELLHWLSHAERELGDLAAAERSLLAALRLAPEHPGLLACYAELLMQAAEWDAAERVLELAAQQAPEHRKVLEARVMLPLNSGNRAETRKAANRFLESAPEHPWGHAALGDSAHAAGNAGEATRHYLDATRLDPANAKFRTAYGRAQLELKWWALPLTYFRRLGSAWGLIIQLAACRRGIWCRPVAIK